MAAPLAAPAVIAAMRALLVADTTLAGLLATFAAGVGSGAAVYAEAAVPANAGFPYLTLGASVELPFNTMGTTTAGGSELTVQVKAFSRQPNDDQMGQILSRAKVLLDAVSLTVTGFGSASCEFDTLTAPYVEDDNGMLVRQWPTIYRVIAHERA